MWLMEEGDRDARQPSVSAASTDAVGQETHLGAKRRAGWNWCENLMLEVEDIA